MSDKEFLIKYEELLNKDYCNCNEMNCIDNNSPRRILNIAKQLQEENQQLKMIIEGYERLNKENGRGFMITSVKQYNIDELIRCEDNWNKLKEYIDIKLYNTKYLQNLCGCRIDDETHMILDIIKKEMQELEGSDNK